MYLTSSVLRLDRGAFPHHLFLNWSGISSWGPSKRKFFPRPCGARTSFGRRGLCRGKTPLSSPLILPLLMSSLLLPPTYAMHLLRTLSRLWISSLFSLPLKKQFLYTTTDITSVGVGRELLFLSSSHSHLFVSIFLVSILFSLIRCRFGLGLAALSPGAE